ncbi:MAG: very short patch repair endonuclease [Burkholderiales bacterium]|nr:very short patch repair endonuclease [Burkholderiales bacterium]
MTDIVDPAIRSRMMAGIRGKDTRPELQLRLALHALGLRYRLHVKGLPGRPDLVFPKHRAVIFVHGCFWHRHQGCRYAATPQTRARFWQAKFERNLERDAFVFGELQRAGWRIGLVWECALRKDEHVEKAVARVVNWLQGHEPFLEIGMPASAAAS